MRFIVITATYCIVTKCLVNFVGEVVYRGLRVSLHIPMVIPKLQGPDCSFPGSFLMIMFSLRKLEKRDNVSPRQGVVFFPHTLKWVSPPSTVFYNVTRCMCRQPWQSHGTVIPWDSEAWTMKENQEASLAGASATSNEVVGLWPRSFLSPAPSYEVAVG